MAWVAAGWFVYHSGPTLSQLPEAGVGALLPSGLAAEQVEKQSAQIFGSSLLPRIAVVQRDPNGLSLATQRRIVEHAVRLDQGKLHGYPKGSIAAPYINTVELFPAARERSTTAITYLAFPSGQKVTWQRDFAVRYAQQLSRLGPNAYATGFIVGNLEQSTAIRQHLHWVEIATVALVAAIIGVYLRSLLAPLVTLATAAVSWLLATRAVAWIGLRIGLPVQQEVDPIIAVLLLGVVTDYSVFFLAGARFRLVAGDRPGQAMRRTTAVYIPIVFTAGWLVALGLATLRVASIGFVQALGPAMAIVVLTSMAVSVTLVPALIGILGRAVFWPGLRGAETSIGRRVRAAVVRLLTKRWLAAPAVLAIAAALCVAGAGMFQTRLGLTPVHGLTGNASAPVGANQAAAGFAGGVVSPTEVVLRAPGIAAQTGKLAELAARMRRVPGVAAALGAGAAPDIPRVRALFRSPRHDAVRYLVVFDHEPYGPGAIDDLHRLEARMPQLLRGVGLAGTTASFAGDTAISAGSVRAIEHDLAWVTLAAFAVNFVLLALFLRALVAPLLLVAASALARAATFGITTYVFQDLIGYSGLTYYVPLAVGVLLLAFGSDYNLFVVGRIWQESAGKPTARAIQLAAPRASRAISVAGVALAFSFATLAIVPLRPFREFGFAMCVGVLIDTFVVRSYLVPSLLALFGRLSWWPSGRGRTPQPDDTVEKLRPA